MNDGPCTHGVAIIALIFSERSATLIQEQDFVGCIVIICVIISKVV